MANYSVWLQNKTHFGAVGDLSLSTGQNAISMSLWFKCTDPAGTALLCGNVDANFGTGGWGFSIASGGGGEGEGQLSWATLNHSFSSPYDSPPSVSGEYGLIAHANPTLIDGNWHSLIATYDGTGVNRNVVSLPDSTHIELDSTTGISAGDRISHQFWSTTVVHVVDATHLQVTDSSHFMDTNPGDTTLFAFTKGTILYIDGVPIFTYADYQWPVMGADYNVAIPFGIGDPQQLSSFSKIGKYAYPFLYYSVLTPTQVSYIAAGHNLSGAVAQWLFTEGSGLTAADSSGNGHTLTFNAIDSWSTDVPFTPAPPPPPESVSGSMFLAF